VPPPDELPLLVVDELPLLLHPAAAMAITARPAIAVVRFIFVIFLSLIRSSGCREARIPARFGPHGPRQLIDGRFDQVLWDGRIGLVSDSRQCPGQGKHHCGHLGRRSAAIWDKRRLAARKQSCRSELARF
jgi:hypothetical protein